MTSKCEVQVRPVADAVVLLLRGEVDGSATNTLLAAYDDAVATHPAHTVVLDFDAVDYINSTGIALIVSVLAKARAQSRTVVASALSDHYREIFAITRLSDFIALYDDADAAVAAAS